MTIDERNKCPECGSARLKTIVSKIPNERIKIRDCEDSTCSKNKEEVWRVIK